MAQRWWLGWIGVVIVCLAASWAAVATDARLYFSADKNGELPITKLQEGESVWIVVVDPDENLDCDVRDKFWTDVKLMDPKTGANIDWESWETCIVPGDYAYVGRAGCTTHGHFFEETDADTGVFVSNVSFRIGRRISWDVDRGAGHWVGFDFDGFDTDGFFFNDFLGDYFYWGDLRDIFDIPIDPAYAPFVGIPGGPFVGWFENMDTLVGLVQDPNDPSDVAISMLKIVDVEATIEWDCDVYEDANGAATVTVVDADENVDCNHVEVVPVFLLVNPGSWNPIQTDSPTTFCSLWRVGGVVDILGNIGFDGIWSWNIYDSGWPMIDLAADGSNQPNADGTWYVEYPTQGDGNVTWFDTASASGVTRVMFYARETGANTGVFQLNLNSMLTDLGFDSLRVGDVLAAYYLDPNDFDDLKVATAVIEDRPRSTVSFTNADREPEETYWIGRDPIYVQVVDANANVDPCCPEQVVVHLCTTHEEDDSEWWILDETGSNSAIFFSNAGMELKSVWNATGIGELGFLGGYQLRLDNWRFEAFNEDDVIVRYNDVRYVTAELSLLGDVDVDTAFPPAIDAVRVANDVSFAQMSVADTQVFDGDTTRMYFLDRNGNRVDGYTNADCVFIEVEDPDQDEDVYRRERIDAYWADVLNAWPFAPEALLGWDCGPEEGIAIHAVNNHLGIVSIFNTLCGPKVYVLNPRNGYWAPVDLVETGRNSGDFISVSCVDLASVHECVPTLGVLPGDTLIAVYQDPSNHSDSAWISIKVGMGGATPGPTSTTSFVDASGDEVLAYREGDAVYVRVDDPSQGGAITLSDAVEIDGVTYDLTAMDGLPGSFMTDALVIDLIAGEELTARYVDPADPTDVSTDTASVLAGTLAVERFVAAPTPFAETCTFGYEGTGTAARLSVDVYDLGGHLVWSASEENTAGITWCGVDASGQPMANGAYVYVIQASSEAQTFTGRGIAFIQR